jgi:hypothetical protein
MNHQYAIQILPPNYHSNTPTKIFGLLSTMSLSQSRSRSVYFGISQRKMNNQSQPSFTQHPNPLSPSIPTLFHPASQPSFTQHPNPLSPSVPAQTRQRVLVAVTVTICSRTFAVKSHWLIENTYICKFFEVIKTFAQNSIDQLRIMHG